MKTATKTCAQCGVVYPRNRSFDRAQWAASRFCSRQCRGATIKGLKTGPKPEIRIGTEVPCGLCGKPFYAAPWMMKSARRRFCSKACGYEGRVEKATFEKGHPDLVSTEARKRAGAKTAVSLTGRKLSPAHCASMSAAMRGRVLTREHVRRSLQRRPMSSLEEKFNRIVESAKLPFRFVGNGEVFIGRKNPDFVASDGRRIAVEVFYRRHKDQFRGGVDVWKAEREAEFGKNGWRVLFFDETQVQAERVEIALGGCHR